MITGIKISAGHPDDAKRIEKMFGKYTGRSLYVPDLTNCLGSHPSVIAERKGEIIGYCYSDPFAPDILELLNMFVSPEDRQAGLGKVIMEEFEKQAIADYSTIILVNSMLYETKEPQKKLATDFFTDNGYNILLSTDNTNILTKTLR